MLLKLAALLNFLTFPFNWYPQRVGMTSHPVLVCFLLEAVSIQLVSPASGDFPSVTRSLVIDCSCFHSIGIPSEWGFLVKVTFTKNTDTQVSIQLVSPASGDTCHLKPRQGAVSRGRLRTPPKDRDNTQQNHLWKTSETLAQQGCEPSDEFASFQADRRTRRNCHNQPRDPPCNVPQIRNPIAREQSSA